MPEPLVADITPPRPVPVDATPEADVAQTLYARLAELGIKNKTLSLLGALYDISIQASRPDELAPLLARRMQADLTCEFAGIFLHDRGSGQLNPLGVATSERVGAILAEAGVNLALVPVPVAHSAVLRTCLSSRAAGSVSDLTDVWGGLIPQSVYDRIASEGHVRSTIAYPLLSGDDAFGTLVICLNRSYDQLVDFERELLESSVNVVSVSLDKALLYQEVESTNAQLIELSRFKSQLLSLASHQIKAPLAAMKGYLGLMLEVGYGAVPDNLQKPMQAMQRSANGLVDLVMSLLDLRRMEEGKMDYDFGRADLADIVRDVVEELTLLATEKGLAVSMDVPAEPVWVRADAPKLKQVVLNFVDNAIKYTPSGSVTVGLSAIGRDAVCTVSDTGLGIAATLLPRLFDEFTRDQRVQHTIRGTGLGLYIAKRIIEAHGGTARAESDGEGKGSRFILTLPLFSEA